MFACLVPARSAAHPQADRDDSDETHLYPAFTDDRRLVLDAMSPPADAYRDDHDDLESHPLNPENTGPTAQPA